MRSSRLLVLLLFCSCGWDPSRPFERDAPAVKKAVADLAAGDAASAAKRIEDYLITGECKDGNIGTPESLKRRADGTFDLGLALFLVGEQFGTRFGEEEKEEKADQATRSQRHALVECARRIVQAIAESDVASDLHARGHYLEGNLAFLDGDYRGAVAAYDRTLALAPGEADGGDPVGRDAAWNRAIALRRIDEQDKKDAGNDAAQDPGPDGSPPSDAGREASHAGGGKEAGADGATGAPDSGTGKDTGSPAPPPDARADPPDASASPPSSVDQDERMLNQLENAPTLQQEEAKRFTKKRVRGMADK